MKKATDDLEERMEVLNEKFDAVLDRTLPESTAESTELRAIEEQRLSTQKCLQICAKLSAYLGEIKIAPSKTGETTTDSDAERIMNDGLQEWQHSLHNTTQKLNGHMNTLIGRMANLAKTGCASVKDTDELMRIQNEIEMNREFLDICFRADRQAKEKISQIDNYATGDDNLQFLVSTDGKVIAGKNRLFGSRTQQLGGHIDGITLRHITQPNANIGIRHEGVDEQTQQEDVTPSSKNMLREPQDPEFIDRYGNGRKLASTSAGR